MTPTMNLYEEFYKQCQTSDRLTDDMYLKLYLLTEDERYRLVVTEKDGVTPLGMAVKRSKYRIVHYLLKEGKADVDQLSAHKNEVGKLAKLTPLMFVTELDIARLLVKYGAKLTTVAEGRTPLHWQCIFENDMVIEYLLRRGADVIVPMENDNTILHYCFGLRELYKLFISCGADVNAQNKYQQTPMHCAVVKGKLWAVEILVQNSADPTIRDDEDYDAIRLACKQQKRDIVDYLALNAGYSNADQADAYELLGGFYVLNDDLDLVIECWRKALKIRLNNGGEFLERKKSANVPETPPYEGSKEILTMDDLDAIANDQHQILVQTFLNSSRILGPHKEDTTQALIEICAAYVGMPNVDKYCYPLQYCLDLAAGHLKNFPQHVKILCTLCSLVVLLSGAELDMSTDGIPIEVIVQLADLMSTTLYCTESSTNYFYLIALLNMMLTMPKSDVQREQLEDLVTLFVRRRIRNKDGFSLLHFATLTKHPEMNDLPGLTDHPALETLETIKFSRTPVVSLLLECGHPVNCLTNEGSTPLHFACRKYQVETVKCLLDYGAHIDHADANGFRPIHVLENVEEINTFDHLTLKCLAAQAVVRHEVPYKHLYFPALETFIETH